MSAVPILEIRDSRLYRSTHATFEDYCRDRWKMARNYANKLILAAVTVANLGTIVPIPTNEAQIRPLTDLEPDQQRKVWLQAVDSAPMGKVTALNVEAAKAHMIATGKLVKREERRKRDEDYKEIARLKAKSAPRVSHRYEIHCCDIRDLTLPAGSVDSVITDPPYASLHLYKWLAEKSLVWLKPGGLLFAMAGAYFIPEVLRRLTIDGLSFHWMFCWSSRGRFTRIHPRHITTRWKPIIAMVKGTYKDRLGRYMPDWIDSPFEENRHHKCGQSLIGFRKLIQRVTDPGWTVVDPFLGGGTTALACVQLNRKFIGCDIDRDAVNTTLSRLSEISQNKASSRS